MDEKEKPWKKNLTPFSQSYQPPTCGRKPSALKKYIKETNIGRSDVAAMIKNVLFTKTARELRSIMTDDDQPMIIRLFIRAYIDDFQNARLGNLQVLLDRAFGPPKQEINISGNLTVTAMTYEQRQELIDGYIKKYQSDMQGGDDLADRPDHGVPGEFEEVEQEEPGQAESENT